MHPLSEKNWSTRPWPPTFFCLRPHFRCQVIYHCRFPSWLRSFSLCFKLPPKCYKSRETCMKWDRKTTELLCSLRSKINGVAFHFRRGNGGVKWQSYVMSSWVLTPTPKDPQLEICLVRIRDSMTREIEIIWWLVVEGSPTISWLLAFQVSFVHLGLCFLIPRNCFNSLFWEEGTALQIFKNSHFPRSALAKFVSCDRLIFALRFASMMSIFSLG